MNKKLVIGITFLSIFILIGVGYQPIIANNHINKIERSELLNNLVNELKNVYYSLIESEYDFEIIAEDPLIVWHFNSLIDVEELNYNIKALADEDCLNKAKALAVAKQIIQIKHDPKLPNILIMVGIAPIIILIMIFFGIMVMASTLVIQK